MDRRRRILILMMRTTIELKGGGGREGGREGRKEGGKEGGIWGDRRDYGVHVLVSGIDHSLFCSFITKKVQQKERWKGGL
jgi:hypothetical protein